MQFHNLDLLCPCLEAANKGGHSGASCQEDPLDGVIKSQGLKAGEIDALRSCYAKSKPSSVRLGSGKSQILFSNVPPDLCACQAKEMVKVFIPEGYDEHTKIVASFSDEPTAVALDPEKLLPGITPASARGRLEGSMRSCMAKTKVIVKKKFEAMLKEKFKKKPGKK
jgi:hypothetical protein